MKKSRLAILLSLTLSLTLFSTRISAQELPKPDSYDCLTRKQVNDINICFDSNRACHQLLERSSSPPIQDDMTYYVGAAVLGTILGIVFCAQSHCTGIKL